MQILNDTHLNSQQVSEEITRDFRKHFERNENENNVVNLRDRVKVVSDVPTLKKKIDPWLLSRWVSPKAAQRPKCQARGRLEGSVLNFLLPWKTTL